MNARHLQTLQPPTTTQLPLQGSQAYAKALSKAGILTQEEADTIVAGLSKVADEWKAGTFVIKQVGCCAALTSLHTSHMKHIQWWSLSTARAGALL